MKIFNNNPGLEGITTDKASNEGIMEVSKEGGGRIKNFFNSLADIYFRPKEIERWKNGRVYEWMGAKQFKKLIIKFGDLYGKEHNVYRMQRFLNSNLECGLQRIGGLSILAESVHSPGALLFGYKTINNLATGNYMSAAGNGIAMLFNAYCSMAQRYTRARIYNILERKNYLKNK